MATGEMNLGQVAFVDKGIYDIGTTYKRFNFVVTDDSCYLSLNDNNTGHPVTDTAWWKCIAKGSQATEAAVKALDATNKALEAVKKAEAAVVQATQQAANASSAAGSANAAAEVANGLIADTETELTALRGLLSEVRTAVKTAQDAYDLVSKINGVDVFAGIPATLVVEETINAVVGSSPIIRKELFPKTANQSVIFQLLSGSGSVTPDGVVLSPTEAGNVVVNVISTISSALWKQVTVKFRALQARTTENGTARTAEDGTAIEC